MSQVIVVQGDTALTPDQGLTNGSFSIQHGGMQMRRAAATARHAILRQAAAQLKLDAAALSIRDGVVIAGNRKVLPIGEFIDRGTLEINLDKDARQKAPADYTIVGRPVQRFDIPDKVTGRLRSCRISCCRVCCMVA
jgi:nicotinate dehydrogenase subunit B